MLTFRIIKSYLKKAKQNQKALEAYEETVSNSEKDKTFEEILKELISKKYASEDDIYLPGHCFKNSYKYIKNNPDWVLVHGTVVKPLDGKRIDHAWCEKDDLVYDPTQNLHCSKEKYVSFLDAVVNNVYDQEQAMINSIKYRSYGPWE